MTEPEVVYRVRRFLNEHGLLGRDVSQAFTDAHPSLTGDPRLRPFQRFALDASGQTVHPDIVGLLDDGQSLFAVEAKGTAGLVAGVHQAALYAPSVHTAWLAAPATALARYPATITEARARGVGVLSVGDREVAVVLDPVERLPTLTGARGVRAAFSVAAQFSAADTYPYNHPTHYLAPVVALEPTRSYVIDEVRDALGEYPIPVEASAGIRTVLHGARKLGVLAIHGREVRLSPNGAAAKAVVGSDVDAWAHLHALATKNRAGSSHPTLAGLRPDVGAVLQLLLLRDPAVDLVVQALRGLPDATGTEIELARAAEALDPAVAHVLFVTPEHLPEALGPDGLVDWQAIPDNHVRGSTAYRFKSILKQAGLIRNTGLGASTPKKNRPRRNVWSLAPTFR